MKNKSSQAGFTLVEMMVVAGVVSVLAVGFSAYLYQQSKHLSSGQGRGSFNQLQIGILNSSGKPDTLVQSESLQKENFGVVMIPCTSPCSVKPDEGGVQACVYDCSDPTLQGQCTTLPNGCTIIYSAQCQCHNTGGPRSGE